MNTIKTLFGAALLAATILPPATAQEELTIRVRAKAQEQVLLLISAGTGPAVRLHGVTGVLRLDLGTLALVSAAPVSPFGISATTLPGMLGLPPALLHCQSVRLGPAGVRISRVFLPLVDRAADAHERQLPPLGPAGANGEFLFGLTRLQILATAARYAQGPIDEARVLHDMRRPFHRAKDPDLVEDVGLQDAAGLMRAFWQGLLQSQPVDEVFRAVESQRALLADARFEARYPQGVPDDDEHWDLASSGGPGATCSREVIVSTGSSAGDYRLKVEARHTDYGVSNGFGLAYGSGTSTGYKKNWLLGWQKNKADFIRVSGTLTTDLQSNSFYEALYDEKTVTDGVYAWYTSSNGSVDVDGRAIWGGVDLNASACDT